MRKCCALLFVWCITVLPVSAQSGPFIFVFLNTNPDKPELPKEQVDSLMSAHLANITRLAKEGKILAAGPFYDGGGIFIMSTVSKDTAWEWLKTDPAVRANRWKIELLQYIPRTGSVCAVGENHEMTTYNFVRYTANESVSLQKSREAWDAHEGYLRSFSPADSVIAEGVLGNSESGIFIYRGEANEEFIKAEPAVRDTILNATIRKIYIAKGSFCEQ